MAEEEEEVAVEVEEEVLAHGVLLNTNQTEVTAFHHLLEESADQIYLKKIW